MMKRFAVRQLQMCGLQRKVWCALLLFFVAVLSFYPGLTGPVAMAKDPAYSVAKVTGRDGKEFLEITIPAKNSRVSWSDVAQALTRALDLNDKALANKIPAGELDLDSTAATLALLAINLTMDNQLYFTRTSDDQGMPALKVRCNHVFIREYGKLAFDRIVKTPQPRTGPATEWDSGYARQVDKPVILCIHGYASDAKVFDELRTYLRSSEYVTGSFSYDFHQAIATSGQQLAEACQAIAKRYPRLRIAIVAHSMGGLVARSMLESPGAPKNVCRLIMIGTPNLGSMWAHSPPILGAMKGGTVDMEVATRVVLGIDDDEGFRDLKPDSAFLKRLNSQPRNPNVTYTCFVGTRGLLSSSEAEQVREAYRRTINSSVATQLVQNRLDPFFTDLSELIDGQGDGAVAVQRCQLAGVQDCEQMPFEHAAVLRASEGGKASPVWKAVLKRLQEDTNR